MTGLEKLCALLTSGSGKRRPRRQSNRYIVYYRVSTKQQGDSGLGLDAQKAAAEAYVRQHNGTIVETYVEVESGRDSTRPEIIKAVLRANKTWSTLLIAKLDRLSRNVFFTSLLMESQVDFVACDAPQASRLTIHILAAVAEEEARLTSERTKAALRAYQARGGVLGPATFRNLEQWKPKQAEARRRATARNVQVARAAYAETQPLILEFREKGLSFRAIAAELDRQGYRTRQGATWNAPQVKRIVDRATVLSPEIS